MKLDYIHAYNTFGDSVVRLYDFGKSEAQLFRDAVEQHLLVQQMPLDLNQLTFIEARNCAVILRLAETDEGMLTENGKHFVCELTPAAYKEILRLLEPYCLRDAKTHQMLYPSIS